MKGVLSQIVQNERKKAARKSRCLAAIMISKSTFKLTLKYDLQIIKEKEG